MFELQSPSKYSPFDAIHLLRRFFPLLKNDFWIRWFWCLLVLLLFCLFVCFISPTLAKCFPLRTFFIWGIKKTSLLGWSWVTRKGGTWGSCFLSKTAEHSAQCGQVHLKITHHEMGKHIERVFKKKNSLSQTQLLTRSLAGTLVEMGS